MPEPGPVAPPDPIFVGAYHKTGTVLLGGIFRRIAEQLGLVFWEPLVAPEEPPRWHILFDDHSRFLTQPAFLDGDGRAVVSIRDPRDVIISGARYHATAKETWLHRPSDRFGGMTYQEKINTFASEHDRFLFEMDQAGGRTIREMLALDRADPRIMTTRLEILSQDVTLDEYRAMFHFLGFPREAIRPCLKIARSRSIFSDKFRPTSHVRHREPQVWRTVFDDRLLDAFRQRFGDAAETLGYPEAAG